MAASEASGFVWQQHSGWMDWCFSCHVRPGHGSLCSLFVDCLSHIGLKQLAHIFGSETKRNGPQVAWKNPTLPLSKDTLVLKEAYYSVLRSRPEQQTFTASTVSLLWSGVCSSPFACCCSVWVCMLACMQVLNWIEAVSTWHYRTNAEPRDLCSRHCIPSS